MLFIPSITYADTVLLGDAHSIDGIPSARELDPTNIHDLAVYFLYPQWVFGMERRARWPAPRSDNKGHPLMLERRDKESYRSASDGTEYFVPEHRIDEFTDGTKESRRMPWVRVTEKEARPGRARRLRVWQEKNGEVA